MKYPFYGSRQIRGWLVDEGYLVNRKCLQRLMHIMGIVAVYPKRKLRLASQAHKVFPYLLSNLEIHRPNQVRATGPNR